MFKNLLENSVESDDNSLHAGMDVKSGTKYVINCWIRDREYVKN